MRPRTGAVLVPERPAYSLGAIVAVCWLERCVPTEAVRESLDDTELDVGDWSDGRHGWVFHVNHSCRSCDNHFAGLTSALSDDSEPLLYIRSRR